ncbi:MAG: hypothetical protein M1814_001805 [Vezdaea aestivalis]|nr:MAG: hypothetical protein M1814_001805 [Vezdaea aestivalis]
MAATPPPHPDGPAPSSEKLSKMSLDNNSQPRTDVLSFSSSLEPNVTSADHNRALNISLSPPANGLLSNGASHLVVESSPHPPAPSAPSELAPTSNPPSNSNPSTSSTPPPIVAPASVDTAILDAQEPTLPEETLAPLPPILAPAITALDSVVEAPESNIRNNHKSAPLVAPLSSIPKEPSPSRSPIPTPLAAALETPPAPSQDDRMDTTEDTFIPKSIAVDALKSDPLVGGNDLEPIPDAIQLVTPEITKTEEAQTELPVEPLAVDKAKSPSPNHLIPDTEMYDAPASPSKLTRARDEDEDRFEEERAVKRFRTADAMDETPASESLPVTQSTASSTEPSLPINTAVEGVTEPSAEESSMTIDTEPPQNDTILAEPAKETPIAGGNSGSSSDEPVITKAQNKYVLGLVRNIKRTKDATGFREPVNPEALGIPTYPDIVKNPMDLGTIEMRLKNEEYTKISAVKGDVELMVNNCTAFNGSAHAITKAAERVRASFEKQMLQLPSVEVIEPTAAEKRAKKVANPTLPKEGAARRPSRAAATAGSPTGDASSPRFALKAGMPLIRRDSTVADGRPKREIKPTQPKDLPYSNAKPKKKKYQLELKFCQEVLDELMKPKHSPNMSIFYEPVDVVALGIPSYHQTIKHPMDLSTVRQRLKDGEYETAKDFHSDVKLMFNNCFKFNPPEDSAHKLGKSAEAVFDQKWASKDKWLESKTQPSKSQTPASSEAESEDDESEEEEVDEGNNQLALMRKQMEQMAEQISQMEANRKKPKKEGPKKESKKQKSSKKEGKGSKATYKEDKKKSSSKSTKKGSKAPRVVTYEEKQEISNGIPSVPVAEMSQVLQIIKENHPHLAGGEEEEMELDIDELSDATLWKLLQFVRKFTLPPPKVPNASGGSRRQSDNAHAPRPKKKNKPMSKYEQDAAIVDMKSKLATFNNPGGAGLSRDDDDESDSSEDEDGSGSESEEE